MASADTTEEPTAHDFASKVEPTYWFTKVDNPPKNPNGTKKKTGNRKGSTRRGPTTLSPSRGSGFEEYYADPPMTPQEAQEEQEEIYAEDLSFEERIQSCLQRFLSRRHLQGAQTLYFNEYLFVGGIDPNPTPFTGTDPNELKRMSTAEQCDATATAGASGYGNDDRFYNGNREIWSVDFSGVAAGFFSSLQPITGWEPEPTEMAIGVVENFLRYVLYHEVCPEYDSDVKKALQVCQDAREEIPMLLRLQVAFPGQLNLAAAKAFGVHDEIDWSLHESFTPADDPKLTLIASLALMDEPGAFERISEWDRRVVRQFECTLEVTRIQRPDSEVVKRFKSLQLADTDGTSAPTPSPVGKARFKPAVIEDQWENPVTTPKCSPMLYLDDDILANMKVGMTITLTICELDVGFRFVKTIHKVVPTYYTFLPQLMMRHFKTPRDMNRPAPSIHDRGGDEAIDGRDVSETGD